MSQEKEDPKVRIERDLYDRAHVEAAKNRQSITAYINDRLRKELAAVADA